MTPQARRAQAFLSPLVSREEFGNRQLGAADEAAQGSLSHLSVIRDGEGREMILLDEHNVATALAGHDPAERFEDFHDFPSTERWNTGHVRR